MSNHRLNPFRYGNPISPPYFVGREDAVSTLFSRIRNGDSTAVVGGPHIGKSSLLRYIAFPDVQSEWLQDKESHAFVELDCQLFSEEYKPADFWGLVLAVLEQA